MRVDYIGHMGDDLTVVNAARVSFDKQSEWEYDHEFGPYLGEKDAKLINYLAKHKHMSPFGHCFVSVRVTAPVFVARQLVKHEYLRMNEISRRYVDSEPEFYPQPDWRGKAKNKKQGSSLDIVTDPYIVEYRMSESGEAIPFHINYDVLMDLCKKFYLEAVNKYDSVAPEQARMVLPQSMMTSWYWSGSLDAFANMYNLRSKEDSQWETRQIANQIGDIISPLFPVAWGALVE